VQSQYYWGRQPYFAQPEDLQYYGTSPFQPSQPWGIQQGYFEQPATGTAPPVYGANLQPIAPGQLTPGQIGGNQPLTQPVPRFTPVTPYEVSPYALPSMLQPQAAAGSATPAVPAALMTYQLPADPNYIYNIAPQMSQYTASR